MVTEEMLDKLDDIIAHLDMSGCPESIMKSLIDLRVDMGIAYYSQMD